MFRSYDQTLAAVPAPPASCRVSAPVVQEQPYNVRVAVHSCIYQAAAVAAALPCARVRAPIQQDQLQKSRFAHGCRVFEQALKRVDWCRIARRIVRCIMLCIVRRIARAR